MSALGQRGFVACSALNLWLSSRRYTDARGCLLSTLSPPYVLSLDTPLLLIWSGQMAQHLRGQGSGRYGNGQRERQ